MAVEPVGTYRPNTMELEVVTRTACSIPFEVRVRFSSELAVRLARRIVQPQVVGREEGSKDSGRWCWPASLVNKCTPFALCMSANPNPGRDIDGGVL